FKGGGTSVGLPQRSARIPTTNGNSFFWIAPPTSTSYVICTRGGRTRSSLCCRLSGICAPVSVDDRCQTHGLGPVDRSMRHLVLRLLAKLQHREDLPELRRVANELRQQLFERQPAPADGAADQKRHRAVRLRAAEEVGRFRQPPVRFGTRANRRRQ